MKHVYATLSVVVGCILVFSALIGVSAASPLRAEMIYFGAVVAGVGPLVHHWLSSVHEQALLRQVGDIRARDAEAVSKAIAELTRTTATLTTAVHEDSNRTLDVLQNRFKEELAHHLAVVSDAIEKVRTQTSAKP
jgi:hypothetical protein